MVMVGCQDALVWLRRRGERRGKTTTERQEEATQLEFGDAKGGIKKVRILWVLG
jgi:hypothetical protein